MKALAEQYQPGSEEHTQQRTQVHVSKMNHQKIIGHFQESLHDLHGMGAYFEIV